MERDIQHFVCKYKIKIDFLDQIFLGSKFNFGIEIRLLNQIDFLDQNSVFGLKFSFWTKIQFLVKIDFLGSNLDFESKLNFGIEILLLNLIAVLDQIDFLVQNSILA